MPIDNHEVISWLTFVNFGYCKCVPVWACQMAGRVTREPEVGSRQEVASPTLTAKSSWRLGAGGGKDRRIGAPNGLDLDFCMGINLNLALAVSVE